MKKLICLFLASMMIISLCACGNSEAKKDEKQEVISLYGPFRLVDGAITMEGISLESEYDAAKKILSGIKDAEFTESISGGCRNAEVIFDDAWVNYKVAYDGISVSSPLGENTVTCISSGFTVPMAPSVFNDPETLAMVYKDLFDPYEDVAEMMENVLVTEHPDILYQTDENGNKEDIVFCYDGAIIFTAAFVDGKSVKISSREEASKLENAQIIEIIFYPVEPLTASSMEYYNNCGEDYTASVSFSAMTSEMYDSIY